ncbi:citryl-CoA lyase [Brevibacterium sp. CFH 10365]|uniref:citryl-CoA lyase n=1 Tax=Brevibacterium sp. CFH 10365 TaxID=2585207 RepID=UPI0012665E25|nr:citryl-CoA lyase [Brevibacterium sp. CFH 10365]
MTEPRKNTDGASIDQVVDWWATSVSRIEPNIIEYRGIPIADLIADSSFVKVIWLLVTGGDLSASEERLLNAALLSAADHGPQAPSIASARMAVTCGIGLNSAMANGVNTLGDVHGGAGQQCVAIIDEMRSRIADGKGDALTVARDVVADHRSTKSFVPGFGHRFHTVDPRRDSLLELVEEAVEDGTVARDALNCGLALEQALSEGRDKPVPMNIDGATAIIYASLGCPPELARGLFVLSRSVGILAHAWEERQSGRRIKGPIPPPLTAPYVSDRMAT